MLLTRFVVLQVPLDSVLCRGHLVATRKDNNSWKLHFPVSPVYNYLLIYLMISFSYAI